MDPPLGEASAGDGGQQQWQRKVLGLLAIEGGIVGVVGGIVGGVLATCRGGPHYDSIHVMTFAHLCSRLRALVVFFFWGTNRQKNKEKRRSQIYFSRRVRWSCQLQEGDSSSKLKKYLSNNIIRLRSCWRCLSGCLSYTQGGGSTLR